MTDDHECLNAIAKLYQFLDQEMDEVDADVIRAHLDACEPCLDRYDVETALRALLKRSCHAARAPEALKVRVVTQIIASRLVYREQG